MKYLRNRKTGVVFPYHKLLAKNHNMEPCDKAGHSEFEEVGDVQPPADPATSGDGNGDTPPAMTENGIVLEKATKAELIKFAYDHYGEALDNSLKVDELRDAVKRLLEDDQ